jgi:tetratricopeptide (TPR) repeat protein
MPVLPLRLTVLFPLVTAAALAFPASILAADPVPWRTDYNTARKEAVAKGLPLFVVIGTDNCFYCRKLEGGPLQTAVIAGQLTQNFIPLKIDASKEPGLAKALKVQLYPTIVLATPDGKIHAFIEGYLEADRLNEHLKRTPVPVPAATDFTTRDYDQASRALAIGDYPRAVSLLKGILREAGDKAIGVKARQMLDDVEKLAAGRLARAKEQEQLGMTHDALDTLAEAVKTYAGTQAASDATTLMAGLAAKPETQAKLRAKTARDLLATAKEEFRANTFYDCMEKCEQIRLAFADLPEAKEAASLVAEIKNNPERLAMACEQMNQRTAAMYLTLAEAWEKKGQSAEAVACYEKVYKLCPNTRQGDIALGQLAKLRSANSATPVGLQKP